MRVRPRHPPSLMNTLDRTSLASPWRFALSPDDLLRGVRRLMGPDRFICSPFCEMLADSGRLVCDVCLADSGRLEIMRTPRPLSSG